MSLYSYLFCVCFIVSCYSHEYEKEYSFVTLGSSIKLKNIKTGYRLHSHEIGWGTGSGQQSVTVKNDDGDVNSLWTVYGGVESTQASSTNVKCGQVVTLKHVRTGNFLHSHNHRSPLSSQQEVSCFPEGKRDSGDEWVVECSTEDWGRETKVCLKHRTTGKYLSTSSKHIFNSQNCGRNCPIAGQLEVSAANSCSKDTKWISAEGFYLPSS